MERNVYVGLDVHADTIAVATAEDGRAGEVRFQGVIENSADSILRLTKRLAAKGARPVFCYEAGPCGYGVDFRGELTRAFHRELTRLDDGR